MSRKRETICITAEITITAKITTQIKLPPTIEELFGEYHTSGSIDEKSINNNLSIMQELSDNLLSNLQKKIASLESSSNFFQSGCIIKTDYEIHSPRVI